MDEDGDKNGAISPTEGNVNFYHIIFFSNVTNVTVIILQIPSHIYALIYLCYLFFNRVVNIISFMADSIL